MTISDELTAKILRYHHVEKWRVGTIANQLNVHHSVVTRVLNQSGIPKSTRTTRESIVAPFMGFIMETLNKYPTLTASRLYEMVRQRGYKGGADHFRYLISLYRPRPPAEAYLRLRTLPGEQAQLDWGHFGHIDIGKARRPLMAFVMVLSYSRKIFLQFYLDARMANFLRGHEAAFTAWNGVPRVVLYLRSAVLERRGDAIRFNPTLLEFAASRRSLDSRLKSARIGRFKPIANFDWDWPKKIDREAIEEFMQLAFMGEAMNIILCGPNGAGKSTIAKNIAYQAIIRGHTALFTTAANMLNELSTQDGDLAL